MLKEAKKKILLVEDNPINKVLAREILVTHGYEVIEAQTGQDAINKAEADKPDLIIMDLNLPEMDGVTATRILKANERCKEIPIIALTASAMRGEEEKIRAEGFDGYMSKPIEIKKFIQAINLYIKK